MSNPFDPNQRRTLLSLLGPPTPPPSTAASELLGLLRPTPPQFGSGSAALDLGLAGGLFALSEQSRRRSDWNARFEHWERSESNAETQRIERARDMVHDVLAKNQWLRGQGVQVTAQGSFTNRTNARLEADIDLRVQHPGIRIEYAQGVNATIAYGWGQYSDTGRTYAAINASMRQVITSELVSAFGALNVDATGNRAIRVKGLAGSRSEVDVVPAFTLHHIAGATPLGSLTHKGIAILSRDGNNWTFNHPDQQTENGRRKRLSTSLQFKRVVRIVKRLRTEMKERGVAAADIPSFLIECLTYLVEDSYFTVDRDDRYGRVRRILSRLSQRLSGSLEPFVFTEINGIKSLFGGGQSWTLETARRFVGAALVELGDL